jgi:hypothetical protein
MWFILAKLTRLQEPVAPGKKWLKLLSYKAFIDTGQCALRVQMVNLSCPVADGLKTAVIGLDISLRIADNLLSLQ